MSPNCLTEVVTVTTLMSIISDKTQVKYLQTKGFLVDASLFGNNISSYLNHCSFLHQLIDKLINDETMALKSFTHCVPVTAWVIGDPHFTTLDGYQYTFNGLGDYQVALIYSEGEVIYDIQGRTKQIFNQQTGQLAGATFFDAFAIKRDNFVVIALHL